MNFLHCAFPSAFRTHLLKMMQKRMGWISLTIPNWNFQYNALCVSKCFLNSLACSHHTYDRVGWRAEAKFQPASQIDRDNGKAIDWLVSNSGEATGPCLRAPCHGSLGGAAQGNGGPGQDAGCCSCPTHWAGGGGGSKTPLPEAISRSHARECYHAGLPGS